MLHQNTWGYPFEDVLMSNKPSFLTSLLNFHPQNLGYLKSEEGIRIQWASSKCFIHILFTCFRTIEEEWLQNNPLSTVKHICKTITLQISTNLQIFYKIKFWKQPHLFASNNHKICTQNESKSKVLYKHTKLPYHHWHNKQCLLILWTQLKGWL